MKFQTIFIFNHVNYILTLNSIVAAKYHLGTAKIGKRTLEF